MSMKLDKIEKMLEKLIKKKDKTIGGGSGTIKEESDEGSIVNGVDVTRIPAKDEYSYGLRLMDILFTKKEMSESLLFSSKKSNKPGLDKGRVSQLLNFIDKRYGKNWDVGTFQKKANQKCRDAKTDVAT